MNPYTLDFSKHKKDIQDSLIEVFGKEFASLIKERFKLCYFVPYVNPEGINSYYRFLIDCKSKEFALKMLEIIGIDVDRYQVINYADDFSDELKDLCENLIGGYYSFEKLFFDTPTGFKSFIPKYMDGYPDDYIRENKIRFINAVKSEDIPLVNDDTLDDFINTEEYERINELALYYWKIYEKFLDEMRAYENDIKEYETYYKDEMERKRLILEKKRVELFKVLSKHLRGRISKHISSLDSDEEKAKALLSSYLEYESDIEYFNSSYEIKLNDDSVSETSKRYIQFNRLKFFEAMGLPIRIYEAYYDEVINDPGMRSLIVNPVFADEVTRLRKLYLDEGNKEFIISSKTYNDMLSYFGGSDADKTAIYNIISKTQVCVSGGHNTRYNFVPIIYYTIRSWQCGCMDYVLLHEIIHAIQCISLGNMEHGCGLEPNIDRPEMSPRYRVEKKRKYERLNEVLTDFFAIEVCENLHKKGIYLLDDKLRTLTDLSKFNTSDRLKNKLRRFFIRYRKHIIEASFKGDLSLLTDYIGEDNFEELNDIIDHIDYLIGKGLIDKLNQNQEDEMVNDYRELCLRLRAVYRRMDQTYEERTSPYSPYCYIKRKK